MENVTKYIFERIKSTDFPLECRGMYYFAKGRHAHQTRKVSGKPYYIHPRGVAYIVMFAGGTKDQINAAFGHDLLEDTETSFAEISFVSGSYHCAEMCSELRNNKYKIEDIGKETYMSEKLVGISDDALLVKLADILYNILDNPTLPAEKRMRINVEYLLENRKNIPENCMMLIGMIRDCQNKTQSSKCEYVQQACKIFVQCRMGNQEEYKKLVEKKPIVKICLTGGIGTGKTYLSKHFEDIGIPVYHSDDEAKKLYTNQDFLNELRDAKFAKKEMWNQDGTLNMEWLCGQFGNKEFFVKFSKFVHLWVHNNFDIWAKRQNAPAVIMESAIVFEYHNESLFDKIIVADAPLWLRIKRVKERNQNLTEDDIMERINAQMPQEEKCKRADLVVCTGETYAIGNLWNKEK